MPGITRAMRRIRRPSKPSHELDGGSSGVLAISEIWDCMLLAVVPVATLRREFRPLGAVDQFPLEAASMAISAQKSHLIAQHVSCCDNLRRLLLVCIVEVEKRFC